MMVQPTRRAVIGGIAAGLVASPAIIRAQTSSTVFPFRLGIASGDPAPDGFVLWTKLAPDPLVAHGGMPLTPVEVAWEVGADEAMHMIVARGTEIARPELAHAVHVEVSGLQPGRPYWYRFTSAGAQSAVGRTRTTPALGAHLDALRFAVCGCQDYQDGLYTAHRYMAGEDIDFVYFYGDYIYEAGAGPKAVGWDGRIRPLVRPHLGGELYSLDDYRRRYAQGKLDPDLQAAHAAAPWFVTIDDHEVDDNWAGLSDKDGTPPDIFALRRAAAFQAWYEHMPVRRASFPLASGMQLYRRARYGDLLDLHLLDTRQFRTPLACGGSFKPDCPGTADRKASVLGRAQQAWLEHGLRDRSARWHALAQQVMMMKLDRRTKGEPMPIRNMDSWAGYDVPRERLLSRLRGRGDAIVLTGDEHQNFAGELRTQGGAGDVVAIEFVGTSISSGGSGGDVRIGADRIFAENPCLKFSNDQRGYLVCDVTPDRWTTQFRVVDKVHEPGGVLSTRKTATVERGKVALNL